MTDHNPPHIATATLSVLRDPDGGTWLPLVERPLPEHAAAHQTPPIKPRGLDPICGGERYARVSKRRVCMPPGVTEIDIRDEERDCPELLKLYRSSLRRRPLPTGHKDIEVLIARSFGAIDSNDFRPILHDVRAPEGGLATLYQAFAWWVDHPIFRAFLEGDPCDRELRRRRKGASTAFGSLAAVFSTLLHTDPDLGLGRSVSAFSSTRATPLGGRSDRTTVTCHATRSSSGGTKGLEAVERRVDALTAIRGLEIAPAAARAILDAAAKVPLAERLLVYRAQVMKWRCPPLPAETVRRIGRKEAQREALLADEEVIQKATAHLTDKAIRAALRNAKANAEKHLRRLPTVASTALAEGRPELVADPSQIRGVIPDRVERRGSRPLAEEPIVPTFLRDDV